MHEFIRALQGGRKVILRESPRPITPFGGLAVCLEFLRGLGLADQVQQHLPFTWRSPNAIPPVTTFTAFLLAVVVGARPPGRVYLGPRLYLVHTLRPAGRRAQRKPSGQIATKPGPNCAEVDAHPNRNRDLNPQPTLKSSANFGFQEAGKMALLFFKPWKQSRPARCALTLKGSPPTRDWRGFC